MMLHRALAGGARVAVRWPLRVYGVRRQSAVPVAGAQGAPAVANEAPDAAKNSMDVPAGAGGPAEQPAFTQEDYNMQTASMLPPKLVRPFNLFVKEKFHEISSTHFNSDEFDSIDVLRRCAKEWRSLTDEEKKPFYEEAFDLSEDYYKSVHLRKTRQNLSEPKKRVVAYQVFVQDHFAPIRRECPSVKDAFHVISEKWHNLSPEERQAYHKRALDMTIRNFGGKLPARFDPHRATRPMTAYTNFVMDNLQDLRQKDPNLSFVEITKICSQLWQKLSAEEKKKYADKFKHSEIEYYKQNPQAFIPKSFNPSSSVAAGSTKAVTAYSVFRDKSYGEIEKKFPTFTRPQILNNILRSWKILSKEEKKYYEEEALRLSTEHFKNHPEQGYLEFKFKHHRMIPAFMLFHQEIAPQFKDTNMDLAKSIREIRAKWNKLTNKQKIVYFDKICLILNDYYQTIYSKSGVTTKSIEALKNDEKNERKLFPLLYFIINTVNDDSFFEFHQILNYLVSLKVTDLDSYEERRNNLTQRIKFREYIESFIFRYNHELSEESKVELENASKAIEEKYHKIKSLKVKLFPNSFALFFKEEYPKIPHTHSSNNKVFQVLHNRWKLLTEEQRSVYEQKRKEMIENFIKENPHVKVPKKYLKEKKTPVKDRVLSGYKLYCNEHLKQYMDEVPGTPLPEAVKRASKEWSEMSKEEKNVYEKRANPNFLERDSHNRVKLAVVADPKLQIDNDKNNLYQIFIKLEYKKLCKIFKNLNSIEINTILGKKWNFMSFSERMEYFEKNQHRIENYDETLIEKYCMENGKYLNEYIKENIIKYHEKYSLSVKSELIEKITEDWENNETISNKQTLIENFDSKTENLFESFKDIKTSFDYYLFKNFENDLKKEEGAGTSPFIIILKLSQKWNDTSNDEKQKIETEFQDFKKLSNNNKNPIIKPFDIFYNESYASFRELNPEVSSAEIGNLISAKWVEMDDKMKEPYELKASATNKELSNIDTKSNAFSYYSKMISPQVMLKHPEFTALQKYQFIKDKYEMLPVEKIEKLKKLSRLEKKRAKKIRELKAKNLPGVFAVFVKDNYKRIREEKEKEGGQVSNREVMKLVAQEWKQMSEEEKVEYKKRVYAENGRATETETEASETAEAAEAAETTADTVTENETTADTAETTADTAETTADTVTENETTKQ